MSDRDEPRTGADRRRAEDPRSVMHPAHRFRDFIEDAGEADWAAAAAAPNDPEIRARYGLDEDLTDHDPREKIWRENHAILDQLKEVPFEREFIHRVFRLWDMLTGTITDALLFLHLDDDGKQAFAELRDEHDGRSWDVKAATRIASSQPDHSEASGFPRHGVVPVAGCTDDIDSYGRIRVGVTGSGESRQRPVDLRLMSADQAQRSFPGGVTDPEHPQAVTGEHAATVVELGRSLPDGTRLLVHCRGGTAVDHGPVRP